VIRLGFDLDGPGDPDDPAVGFFSTAAWFPKRALLPTINDVLAALL